MSSRHIVYFVFSSSSVDAFKYFLKNVQCVFLKDSIIADDILPFLITFNQE